MDDVVKNANTSAIESDASPVVSVIVPTHNREKVIVQTLDSIHQQTFKDFEVLVVDDCSTDRTCEIVESYCQRDSRFKLYPQDINRGAPACRNLGLKLSKGRYINFVDSDDLLDREKFAKQVPVIEASNADFVLCQVNRFKDDDVDQVTRAYGGLEPPMTVARFLENEIAWSTIAPLWQRVFIVEIGGFQEDLECFQDWELNVRALSYAPEVSVVDQVLGYYREPWDSGQITADRGARSAEGMFESRKLAFDAYRRARENDSESRAAIRTQLLGAGCTSFKYGKYLSSLRSILMGLQTCDSFRSRLNLFRSYARGTILRSSETSSDR